MTKRAALFFVTSALAGCSCGGGQGGAHPEPPRPPPPPETIEPVLSEWTEPASGELRAFPSREALDGFLSEGLERLLQQQEAQRRRSESAMGLLNDAEADGSSSDNEESITNNQEEGVDEGAIVKAHGDHLVILRRGRLFTVDVGADRLEPISQIDVFPPGQPHDGWFDEMLVHDDTVIVVGYSYELGGTELGLFSIGDDGRLVHRETFLLHSNDYYSSRNYASRVVGDQLIFYMPHYLYAYDHETRKTSVRFPQMRPFGQDGWDDIIDAQRVYGSSDPDAPQSVLHSVVRCDLTAPSLTCDATGILGGFSRNFYVSRDAVYVWTGQQPYHGAQEISEVRSQVYRLPLDGSEPGAVLAWGAPTDQFSFRERGGRLQVLVRSMSGGDAMWAPELSAGDVALATIPLGAFSVSMPALLPHAYQSLPRPEGNGWAFQNRFVGDHVLYGLGSGWGHAQEQTTTKLTITRASQRAAPRQLGLPHGVDRLEVMGDAAVVVGSDGHSLHFSEVLLQGAPRIRAHHEIRGVGQGETRSHGFFYRGQGEGTGIVSLPVRSNTAPGYAQLRHGSASIVFLRRRQGSFSALGDLVARPARVDDRCRVSCVDWYGNARPIFYRGRMFALLGYELVEGRVAGDAIQEVARLRYLQ